MLEDLGFIDVEIGPGIDTFGGKPNAQAFDVKGHAFLARKPG